MSGAASLYQPYEQSERKAMSLQSSSRLPEELRGYPSCVLLSLGSCWQWGRDGGPSVCCKYCSSCVLQSVSHASRTVGVRTCVEFSGLALSPYKHCVPALQLHRIPAALIRSSSSILLQTAAPFLAPGRTCVG
ncbi:hypothetical protein Anapl_08268 [Anas platyrhynchos]|uniref:Uncharacterized protein n=1 Tax=Anas platyrhynchos TaxID=8839 RepID=R0KMG6_ANAPL|nr:hypothetical protein Anapl_08268 [Anas platyrhynchos]